MLRTENQFAEFVVVVRRGTVPLDEVVLGRVPQKRITHGGVGDEVIFRQLRGHAGNLIQDRAEGIDATGAIL